MKSVPEGWLKPEKIANAQDIARMFDTATDLHAQCPTCGGRIRGTKAQLLSGEACATCKHQS